jgi:hypothetical protein
MQKLEQQKSQDLSKKESPSKFFNITVEGFQTLTQAGLDMNSLFLLDCLRQNYDIGQLSEKMEAWKQNLWRKGFITDENKITLSGNTLLSSVESGLPFQTRTTPEVLSSFELWWKTYPSTDQFEYRGKLFKGSRALRLRKSECNSKFQKILNEGEITVEDLIRALEHEIEMKKERSFEDNENKMRYMQNSLTYLTQRTFDNFIEVSKTKLIKKSSTITDI